MISWLRVQMCFRNNCICFDLFNNIYPASPSMKSLSSSDGTTIEVSREASSYRIVPRCRKKLYDPLPGGLTEALQTPWTGWKSGKEKSFLARGELDEVTSDTFDLSEECIWFA